MKQFKHKRIYTGFALYNHGCYDWNYRWSSRCDIWKGTFRHYGISRRTRYRSCSIFGALPVWQFYYYIKNSRTQREGSFLNRFEENEEIPKALIPIIMVLPGLLIIWRKCRKGGCCSSDRCSGLSYNRKEI